MSLTLAVVGKGGTGKTTFAALTVKYLREVGITPILAIDADPSSNLNMALGMELDETVGQIREDTRDQVTRRHASRRGCPSPTGSSTRWSSAWSRATTSTCWPWAGPRGRAATARPTTCCARPSTGWATRIRAVVIDNEAGMEHISRQTTRDVDWLFIVSDPSQRGLAAAEQIVRLDRLPRNAHRAGRPHRQSRRRGTARRRSGSGSSKLGVPLLGALPQDPAITRLDAEGRAARRPRGDSSSNLSRREGHPAGLA